MKQRTDKERDICCSDCLWPSKGGTRLQRWDRLETNLPSCLFVRLFIYYLFIYLLFYLLFDILTGSFHASLFV